MKENIETCIRNEPKEETNQCTVKDRTPSVEECRNCEFYDPKMTFKQFQKEIREFLGIYSEFEVEI